MSQHPEEVVAVVKHITAALWLGWMVFESLHLATFTLHSSAQVEVHLALHT